MTRSQPTATDASLLKLAFANRGIKARVRRFDWSLRVCLNGETSDDLRARTVEVMRELGFAGPCGSEPCWNQPHEAFAYKVAA